MANSIRNDFWFQQFGINPTTNTKPASTQFQTDNTSSPIVFQSEEALASSENSNLESIEAEYAAAEEAISGTSATTEASGTTATAGTGAASEEIKEELEELEAKKEENIEKMEKIEDEIESLAKSAEEHIMEAAKAQDAAVKEHEEETKAVLDENIQAYINANKEGGEGMTRDELQKNIKAAMPNTPEIADAVAALTAASEEVAEIDNCLGELNKLITDTQLIDDEIELKTQEYEAAVQEETCPPPTNCEPQGFQDSEGNQYDFFIDKDGNGDLSNESEFLGYEGGKEGQEAAWSEMTDLDTNLDGIVDANELTAGGVMVYKTDANGNQQALTIEEAFGEDSDLAISTTQHEEAKEGVGPNNFNTGVGSENNELWGTFDVTLNGETLNGYQTNDDLEWLKNNYDFTDYANEDSLTESESAIEYSEELEPHVNFFNLYTEKSAELKEQIQEGFSDIGLSKEQMDGISEATKKEADEEAKNFFASLEETENTNEKIAENGTKGQTVEKKDSETTNAETSTKKEDEDKLREEELIIAA